MPVFTYKARDEEGRLIRGSMTAEGRHELADKLRKMGYMATEVSEAAPAFSFGSLFERFSRVGTDDLLAFYVQLSGLIGAGVSILGSLSTIARQLSNRRLKGVVGSVARAVEGGEHFSQALSHHPSVFPKIFVSLVRAGEVSGRLENILLKYAQFSEEESDLRRKIQGAVLYPGILLAGGVAVTLFIVTVLIPQFASIFTKAGVSLPLPTRILCAVGEGIKRFWLFGILAAVFSAALAVVAAQSRRWGRVLDRWALELPFTGPLLRKALIARFSRTLETLTDSGVPILESLEITRDVVQNRVLAQVIDDVRRFVEKGEKISDGLRLSEQFPDDAVQMIAVGEESGELSAMLGKIADFYEKSVERGIQHMTVVMEPLILTVMGCMVGFIMISMLLPILELMQALRR